MTEEPVVVQAPKSIIRRDGDGHFLFEAPCSFYIQDGDGEPLGEEYTEIKVEKDGTIKIR